MASSVKRAQFLPAARLEFLAEVAYYSEVEAGLGARLVEAVEEAASLAVAFPLIGSSSGSGTRRVFLKGFPFSLVYRVEESEILIVAIAHHARKPGYWRSRLQEP